MSLTDKLAEIRDKLDRKTLKAMQKAFYCPRPELAKRWGLENLLKIARAEREELRIQRSLNNGR